MSATKQIGQPVVDLLRYPEGPRERQLLLGDIVHVLGSDQGWTRIRADKDGYAGFVPTTTLTPETKSTHWVTAPATHVYAQADMQSPDRLSLSFGSRVQVLEIGEKFARTSFGFIPVPHLSLRSKPLIDPIAIAASFLGTPYLWGGNSRWGIDCSGLVQAALLACGHPCPGDSGDQERALGTVLPEKSVPQRGDLLFWKGHVAWVVNPQTILHANAHHMAVAYEPLHDAIQRIEDQGDGPVTSHRRVQINQVGA